jgi:hypothetical protein
MLRTACIAFIYSATEYCPPVWLLNNAMRLITGTVKSTTFPGLPVLNNIAPLRLRREVQGRRELKNSWSYDKTLLFEDCYRIVDCWRESWLLNAGIQNTCVLMCFKTHVF